MTDAFILFLLKTPKRISTPPKPWKTENKYKRRDFDLSSIQGDYRFHCFVRHSIILQDDWSIGAQYEPADGSDPTILMRCNGPHGPFNDNGDIDHPHWTFHVHRASEAAITAGKKPEKFAEATTAFSSLQQATRFFLDELQVELLDQQAHFKPELAMTLFEDLREGGVS